MKISLIKFYRKQETVTRQELPDVVQWIQDGPQQKEVRRIRQVYHLMNPQRLEDGRVMTQVVDAIKLPRVCFAAEYEKRNGKLRMLKYNGLVVLEVNDLQSYEQAVAVKNKVRRMPQTVLCFLGGSGKSVKIVCRGELFADSPSPAASKSTTVASNSRAASKSTAASLPEAEADIRQFHHNIYETARQAYQAQFGLEIPFMEPRLDRTVYLSSDPEVWYNADAMPFLADVTAAVDEPVEITDASDSLMPGRTMDRTYQLNWLFITETVMGRYFDLPDDERLMAWLMEIASRCLNEGIPMARAQNYTLMHPVLCQDELLVRKVFSDVYAVTLQEDYMKKHKMKPLKSIPDDTIQTMKTEIFLNENYDMRKNLLTGVAEYRERFSADQTFRPLTEEVRNDMTIRATELGLKSWDRDVNRFIDSTRIEQYDPVNAWLDKLPEWDGEDHIGELARRVPTENKNWEKYLRCWIVGMVAQWRESDKQLTGNALTPLLIGRQGCGKTRFCKILLPSELRDYYNDKINFKNEFDLNIALTSFALINIDEFDKTTSSQQIVLKYLLSSSDVKFRPPYGKTIKQYRRYTSFIGTTNQQKPLVDPTGSRRFVCVGVTGNINFQDNINHRQLYAQALHLFNHGERYWLNDDEIRVLISENEPYQRLNDLVEMIGETFRKPKEGEGRWWSLADVSQLLAERFANYDPDTPFIKLGLALSDHQFDFKSRRLSHTTEYWLMEKNA